MNCFCELWLVSVFKIQSFRKFSVLKTFSSTNTFKLRNFFIFVKLLLKTNKAEGEVTLIFMNTQDVSKPCFSAAPHRDLTRYLKLRDTNRNKNININVSLITRLRYSWRGREFLFKILCRHSDTITIIIQWWDLTQRISSNHLTILRRYYIRICLCKMQIINN